MMTEDLFPPQLVDLVRCVEREIRWRERVYPRRIAAGKMTQQNARREIGLMQAVLDLLREHGKPGRVF